MKRAALLILVALMVALPGTLIAGEASTETLNGEYQWNRKDEPGAIKAVFTATGEEQWSVDFHFNFEGEDHVYSGTATGSLTNGALMGKVMSDGDEPRPFTFEGTVEEGVFNGTHAFIDGDEEQQTGTITLGG